MKRTTRRLAAAITIVTAVVAGKRAARADEKVVTTETRYTVRAGDTCAAIAQAHYGDSRLVDIIHAANPGMGPAPHNLKAGTVLVLPPAPAKVPAGPDARLTRMRNKVEVLAPEPREAKPNDPLYRGNRVGTKESSSADVTFRDESRVMLGENTLVVILGDVNASSKRVAQGGEMETTLVTGSLRSRLSELAGKSPAKPRVATDSGSVELKSGEAQVTVDEKKTTRVAVYKGASALTAQKKSVEVADGFGSKADVGSAPTPPKPLPLAPEWPAASTLAMITTPATDLSFDFRDLPPASSPVPAPAPAEWHVQVARDPDFTDLVVDARVPLAVRKIDVRGATPGTYFAQVSAIDADRFEGKWSTLRRATVASLAMAPLPGRKSRVAAIEPANLVRCTGAATDAVIDRSKPLTIACTTTSGDAVAGAKIALAPLPLTNVKAAAELVDLSSPRDSSQSSRAAQLRVRLTDESGAPVEGERVVALRVPNGMHVLTTVASSPLLLVPVAGSPGVYAAPVVFDGTTDGPLELRVADEVTALTNAVHVDASPRMRTRYELAATGRLSAIQATQGGAAGVGLDADLAVPFSLLRGRPGRVIFGAGGSADRIIVAKGSITTGEDVVRARGNVWAAHLTLGYRLGDDGATWSPYAHVGPEVVWTVTRVGEANQRVDGHGTLIGAIAAAGVELRTGRHSAVFAEVSGRLGGEVKGTGQTINVSGGVFSLGHRFGF